MPPRFVDASVFVHAFLKPKRALEPHERRIKANAQAIVSRINRGEEVATSTVHLAEVASILEERMPLDDARTIQLGLCHRETVQLLPVARPDFIEALSLGGEAAVGTPDALAVVLMKARGLNEVYSFDRDFDHFEGVHRITQ